MELTPEEQVIADKWEAESKARDAVITELEDIINGNEINDEQYRKVLDKLVALDPIYCEHGRSTSGTCISCDELSKKLHPECYATCNVCLNLVDPDELEDGRCFDCYEVIV